MDRQYVNLVGPDQSVDDAVRWMHHFPDQGIFELWNCSDRLGNRTNRSAAAMRRDTMTDAS
jgi:hypothetical protein